MVRLFDFNKYYIFGAGRHAEEVFYLCLNSRGTSHKISGFIVESPMTDSFLNLPVYSLNDFLLSFISSKRKPKVLVAVGDVKVNQRVNEILRGNGIFSFSTIHKSVNLRSFAHIGVGVTICQGSVFTTKISIGSHSIINIGCTISHDVQIGAYVNICPGVNIAGGVTINDGVFIGTGAVILPKVIIGTNCVIGAGAVVTKNIEPNLIVVGNPAKFLKENSI
jgi:sugar O-acyltransferase (sialic acid O-acetyltransferase NeuD family)